MHRYIHTRYNKVLYDIYAIFTTSIKNVSIIVDFTIWFDDLLINRFCVAS
jgi:hypothetical protein